MIVQNKKLEEIFSPVLVEFLNAEGIWALEHLKDIEFEMLDGKLMNYIKSLGVLNILRQQYSMESHAALRTAWRILNNK